jgi:hypothetical protein
MNLINYLHPVLIQFQDGFFKNENKFLIFLMSFFCLQV